LDGKNIAFTWTTRIHSIFIRVTRIFHPGHPDTLNFHPGHPDTLNFHPGHPDISSGSPGYTQIVYLDTLNLYPVEWNCIRMTRIRFENVSGWGGYTSISMGCKRNIHLSNNQSAQKNKHKGNFLDAVKTFGCEKPSLFFKSSKTREHLLFYYSFCAFSNIWKQFKREKQQKFSKMSKNILLWNTFFWSLITLNSLVDFNIQEPSRAYRKYVKTYEEDANEWKNSKHFQWWLMKAAKILFCNS